MSKLGKDELFQVLLAPVVTEKSTRAAEQGGQVVFNVLQSANRQDVKAAIEQAFDVEVETVRIMNVKGKSKRFGRALGKRSDRKKAYIRLKEGSDIDFAEFQA
ncbi:MAG: 50S ribosomal protein L23 [Arenicella sp.]|jgi:large subunit ribosomal protein L23|nr:50S ribosomal protein L23 [Arenicella sp.]